MDNSAGMSLAKREESDYNTILIFADGESMEEKKTTFMYKIILALVKLFYPPMETVGLENLPDEPAVIVGNHTQMNGPIACETRLPVNRYTWCAGEMMAWKEVPAYAYRDFWSQKPRAVRWFYKILSYLITPLAVCLFNNARTIPVYHDTRVLTTFRTTVNHLQEGSSIVIFPEHNVKFNHILYDFQDRFIDLGRMYYRKTGKALAFVPLYIAPKLRKMVLGKPIRFRPEAPLAEERQRICDYLKAEITSMADALPLHTVIPYRNIPKRLYPTNHPQGETPS